MATITYREPIESGRQLKPGEAEWVHLGQSDEFLDGAISVTAIPYRGTDGPAHVMRVENINITCIEHGEGQASTFHAGCSVVNNGQTTIDQWRVVVGVIRA